VRPLNANKDRFRSNPGRDRGRGESTAPDLPLQQFFELRSAELIKAENLSIECRIMTV
jgi:hypothetical protein